MEDEAQRWNRVKEVFQDALEWPDDDREPFLSAACGDDRELQREVESLLVAHAAAGSFARVPAIGALTPSAADAFANPAVPRYIGQYEVLSFLGAGGMGEVYRARDPRLGREVAIKILPETFAQDAEHQARLEREAQMLAALNHPHIAHVYGLEQAHSSGSGGRTTHALIMELVEGEALTRVLEKGSLPVDVALRHATQIADALAAAHARGIVHRDLKPGNVMITPAGVKVLDFGLAKRSGKAGAVSIDPTSAPGGLTTPGQILGTVAYMSPEQAEGKPVDARSDVFAFGVVLYEILCGQRPFRGDSSLATLASTLRATPPRPRTLRKEIPDGVDRIVMRCLAKDPAGRYDSAAELQRALTAVAVPSTRFSIQRASLAGAAVAILIGVVGLGARSYVQASRVKWVEEKAVPEISRLINENRRLAALTLFQQAQRSAPGSRKLFTLEEGVAAIPVTFRSSPAGARIYISDYAAGAGDNLAEWRLVGEAPVVVDQIPRWGYYRVLATKDGFASTEHTFSGPNVELTLHPQGQAPAGMVWVPAGVATSPAPPVKLPEYWIDRFEVTNRQFKEFVDAGGYRREEFWQQPFRQNGHTLSFAQALEAFHDQTGRPGPATWQLGTYPDGSDDLPVGGVSWYEALAYAEFAGKSLPTVYEWFGAASIVGPQADILTLSNFGGRGPAKVGANRGMAPYGTYDMAGNVKEWTVNPTADEHYLLGGAWSEDDYVFSGSDARPPFSREATFGFRCVRRLTLPADDTFRPVTLQRAFHERTPVDDQTFRRFLDLHAYEKSDLDARVERLDRSSPYWRRETVTFRAAYNNERVIAHLFLPTNAAAPYQVVAYFGGSGIFEERKIDDMGFPYQFLVRSGRAVVIPAYSGSLERGPTPVFLPPNQMRDRAVRWSMDLGRTVDYMETRPDLDTRKLGFYGVSWGAMEAPRLIAVDGRFKALVMTSGGLGPNPPEEIDAWNFAPRVHIPVLMLNGRNDFMVPYEPNQRLLFEALGAKDKIFKRYDGGHANLVTRPDLIGEILGWLDKYLGPVDIRP